MKNFCFSLLLASFFGVLELSFPSVGLSQVRQTCNPIGRIVSGTGQNQTQRTSITSGQIICAGDQLSKVVNVKLLCFRTRSQIELRGTAQVDRQTCAAGSKTIVTEPCVPGRSQQCFRAKGPVGDLRILEPNQTTISDKRPRIAWEPYPSVNTYLVRVTGPGMSWERVVLGTRTEYPITETPFEYGNAYRIVVLAKRGQSFSLIASTVVNVVRNGAVTSNSFGR
ncbi:hypothetical protein ACQ4M3_07975 [Leptolyngbya sp. AN03gr2]|uniref:hypothetical protein n=1 Tax=unclassified Leptolyngbya TaxID=2650499 RepID=UPI003D3212EB